MKTITKVLYLITNLKPVLHRFRTVVPPPVLSKGSLLRILVMGLSAYDQTQLVRDLSLPPYLILD